VPALAVALWLTGANRPAVGHQHHGEGTPARADARRSRSRTQIARKTTHENDSISGGPNGLPLRVCTRVAGLKACRTIGQVEGCTTRKVGSSAGLG